MSSVQNKAIVLLLILSSLALGTIAVLYLKLDEKDQEYQKQLEELYKDNQQKISDLKNERIILIQNQNKLIDSIQEWKIKYSKASSLKTNVKVYYEKEHSVIDNADDSVIVELWTERLNRIKNN